MNIETILGAAVALFAVASAAAVIYWPEPAPKPVTPDPAALLTAERVRMHTAAANIADDEALPDTMTPALLDLADRLALDVHEGRRTPASAMQYLTATCRRWSREISAANASA